MSKSMIRWILRFIKGIFIGSGFILPGVSGGALAAIFGLYEHIISFAARFTRDFKKQALPLVPVALGMGAGIVLLSYPLSFFLERFLGPTMWFFIGAIAGTFPSLWKEAAKKGRAKVHIVIMLIAFVVGFTFLRLGSDIFAGQAPQNAFTWILAGALIALGILLPGFSPSNFLLYMGMYGAMVDAVKRLDFSVLLPIAAGGLLCLLALSKLIHFLLRRYYAGLFHIILGVVAASTLMIVPMDYNYLSWGALVCVITFAGGAALGWWMSGLEERYAPAKGRRP